MLPSQKLGPLLAAKAFQPGLWLPVLLAVALQQAVVLKADQRALAEQMQKKMGKAQLRSGSIV